MSNGSRLPASTDPVPKDVAVVASRPGTPAPNDSARKQTVPSAAIARPGARAAGRFDTDPSAVGTQSVRGVRSVLVGRDAAMTQFLDAVHRALEFSAPQLVSVIGNQGTGKSRLVAESIASLSSLSSADKPRVFHGRATAERGSALSSLLRDRFALTDNEVSNRQRFTEVVRQLAGNEPLPELCYLLGGLIGLDFPPSSFLRVMAEDPRQKVDLVKTALIRLFEFDAALGPVVLVFDDMHLCDNDTVGLLCDIVTGLGGRALTLVVIARPELLVQSSHWGTVVRSDGGINVDHMRLELRNLEPDDAETMFRHLLARCPDVPIDIAEEAVGKTGGNPLFLEQLVHLLLDNGTIDASGPQWRLDAQRAADTELPISIEGAIAARIAALEPDERDLLERAAVFGNVFWLSAVIAMSRSRSDGLPLERGTSIPSNSSTGVSGGWPVVVRPSALGFEWDAGEPVRRRLSDLVAMLAERDYLLTLDQDDSSMAGDTEIVFKHNLERELIVQSTEPQKLMMLHLSAAQWLEAKSAGRSEEQFEALAGLYQRGGDRVRAAQCYFSGADRARRRYAPDEARNLYERGLALLGHDHAPLRMEALHNLGDVLEQAGHGEEAAQRFTEMLELAWLLDNFSKGGAAYTRLGRHLRRAGRYDAAMEHLRRAHELFTGARDDRGISSALDDMGRVHWLRGAFVQALDYHRQALTIRRALGDKRSIALSLANIGRVHHDSGNFKAAISQLCEALELRRAIADVVGIVQSLGDLAGVQLADNNPRIAIELLNEAHTLATESGDKLAVAEVLSRSGEAKAMYGQPEEGLNDLNEAKASAVALGDRVLLALTHGRLASVHLMMGAYSASRNDAQMAVTVSESVGLRVQVGCGYRTLAEVHAATGNVPLADEHFRRAIDVLAVVKHELELARAYRGYAALKMATGLGEEAVRLSMKADEIFARLRGAAATQANSSSSS
jgi:tetratricopeptide (TPR) repeat protein